MATQQPIEPIAFKGESSKLDMGYQMAAQGRKSELKAENLEYVKLHPEIKQIMSDFVASTLLEKPRDFFEYAKNYFSCFLPRDGEDEQGFTGQGVRLNCIVLSGINGAGKSALVDMLLEEFPEDFSLVISHTTRPPRPGEEDGVHFHFDEKATLEEQIETGKFLEYSRQRGVITGTHKFDVEDIINDGKIAILDVDMQGLMVVKEAEKNFSCQYLCVMPPTLDALENRLRSRGAESEDRIRERMASAKWESAFVDKPDLFDNIIVNDDLGQAYQQLRGILMRSIRYRQAIQPPSRSASDE